MWGAVAAAAFSVNGRRVLIGGVNGVVRVWDIASAKPVGKPFRHPGAIRSAALGVHGRRIVTGDSENAWIWDAESGTLIDGPLDCPGAASAVAFNRQGTSIAVGGLRSTQVWTAPPGQDSGTQLSPSLRGSPDPGRGPLLVLASRRRHRNSPV